MSGALQQMFLATSGGIPGQGSFTGVEGADVGAFVGDIIIQGILAATDGADAAALSDDAFATFDGTGTNVTLSNGDLTAKHSNTTLGGARSTAQQSSGKFYFEVTADNMELSGDVIGVLTAAGTYTNMVTNATNFGGCYRSGNIYANDAFSTKTLGTIVDGNIIGMAVDLDNEKIWLRKAPSGNWNGEAIGSQDPGNNVGGVSISNYSGTTMAPAVGFSVDVDTQYTMNAGQSAFSGTVPSGFTAGWTE